jgi:hypothetical protein
MFLVAYSKSRTNATFVEDQRKALERFERKSGKVAPTPAPAPRSAIAPVISPMPAKEFERKSGNVAPTTAPAPPSALAPVTQFEQKSGKVATTPASATPSALARAISTVPARLTPAAVNPAFTPAAPSALPLAEPAAPVRAPFIPPASQTIARQFTESPPPVAGPSSGRVIRISRRQVPAPMDVDEPGSSSDDYRPSSPPAVVKKERRKSLDSDDLPLEIAAARKPRRDKKDRREAEPTGEIHETPCQHCAKKNVRCQKERAGGACVLCYRGKIKCSHSAVRKVSQHRRMDGSSVPAKRRQKKSNKYVPVTDEESGKETRREKGKGRQPAQAAFQSPAPHYSGE